jgi:hypothetical protein
MKKVRRQISAATCTAKESGKWYTVPVSALNLYVNFWGQGTESEVVLVAVRLCIPKEESDGA